MKKILILSLMKRFIICAVILSAFSPGASTSGASSPVLFFSGLTSGPKTGDENNNGVYVTLYGNFFGSNATVTVGDEQALIKTAPTSWLWYPKIRQPRLEPGLELRQGR